MKKLYIITYIALTLPFFGWGQEAPDGGDEGDDRGLEYKAKVIKQSKIPSFLHPPPNTSHSIYTARDTIRLLQGFNSADVKEKPFIARINESLIFPVEYQDPIDPNRPIDESKEVGAIAGVADVSPTGAATYQIPIFTPPGTAGIQPQISIVYNSQGGNGLLGVGWDIAGLSAVTRTGQTIYHDGDVKEACFQLSDRYALDGNRLILLNGDYNLPLTNMTFATEIETFSRITAPQGLLYPSSHFIVETKNGDSLEYGVTADSKFELEGNFQNKFFSWRLNKVTDANKNYIKYIYHQEAGESYIKEIQYTGNSSTGLQPYNSICFYYESVPEQFGYVGGYKYKNKRVLYSIKVKCEGNIVRDYRFSYRDDEYSLVPRLNEIREIDANGKEFNSTIVQWGEYQHGYSIKQLQDTTWETNVYVGDFNGDGRSDIFLVYKNWSKWELYIADENGGFMIQDSGTLPGSHEETFVTPPNIFGRAELILHRNPVSNGDHHHKFSRYAMAPGENTLSEITSVLPNFITDHPAVCVYSANFTGNKDGSLYHSIAVDHNKNFKTSTLPLTQNPNFNSPYYIQLLDFNGDGKMDILVVKGNGSKIFTYNNTLKKFDEIYSGGFPTQWHTIYPGDYNGDGKTDLLTYVGNQWHLDFSNGMYFTAGADSMDIMKGWEVIQGDFNGDGKTDLVLLPYGKDLFYIYYSLGDGQFVDEIIYFDNYSRFNSFDFFNGDFNGKGKQQLLMKHKYCVDSLPFHSCHRYNLSLFSFHENEQKNLVQSITDGLNNKTQFEYQPLTKGGSFYDKDETLDSLKLLHVHCFQGALYAVSKMTQPNGYGIPNGTTSLSFFYKGARIHRFGKGFLCFKEITSYNNRTNSRTINNYDYHPTYFNVYLKESQTKLGLLVGASISTIAHTPNTHHFGNKRILPYIEQSVATNHLTGEIITEDFLQYDFTHGNLTKKKTTYGAGADFTETTDYIYDKYGSWSPKNRLTKQTTTTKHADHSSNYTRYVNYNYDGKGNLITTTTDNGIVTNYQNLNAFGQPKTITVTAPGSSSYTKTLNYDTKGRFVVNVTDPLGSTYQDYSASGKLRYEVDITGLKTSYKYDGFGRLTGTKTPEGHIITTEYKWNQDPILKSVSMIETKAPGRPTATAYYDVLGREVRSKTTGYDEIKEVITDKKYNNKGQLEYSSMPYFNGETPKWTYNEYYSDGRIKKVTAQLTTPLVTNYNYSGNTITITSPDGKKVAKTYNAHGDLVTVVENNDTQNAINYKYHSSAQPKRITMPGMTIDMGYDAYGRQTILDDHNAGIISYTYNAFGDVLTQTDARGKVTTNTYDNLRRLKTQAMTNEPTKTYNYNPSGSARGQLKSITSSQAEQHYDYGEYGRLTKLTEKIVGDQSFVTQYEYDQYGNKTGITYPGGFKVKRLYNDKGYVTEIRQASNNQLIWQRLAENALGQPLTYKMGNSKITTNRYNGNYLPDSSATPGVQEFTYSINPLNGNMKWRRDKLKNLREDFCYDNLNRLDTVTRNNNLMLAMQYFKNGNIQQKSDAGVYDYQLYPAHAVDRIYSPSAALLNSGQQEVEYNAFHKTSTLYNNQSQRLVIDYGVDQQRMRTRFYTGHFFLQKTKYFAANYEKEVTSTTTREINYISTPYGVLATFIKEGNNVGQMYYLYKDHLGSITHITNASGTVVERRSFDAWGRPRHPDNWGYTSIPAWTLLDRGYTGHEHLFGFDLINMNGRIYDPIIGRFLSPDPYVQGVGTQGFNRYSYARNNPLKYTDPTGEFLITFIVNAIKGSLNGNGWWKEGWQGVGNQFTIFGGLFTTDINRHWTGQVWELLSRHSWQGIQTAIGHLYSQFSNMAGQVDRVEYKAGSTVLSGRFWGQQSSAVTMGSFINGGYDLESSFDNYLFQHEYGHYLQSQASGFWYFQRYAIPSAFSGGIFKNHHNYHPVEQDANARAFKYFSKKVSGFNWIDENENQQSYWKFDENPIIGYDRTLSSDDSQNQLALKYARLRPAWHDWILLPNLIISGPAINTPVLNGKKRYYKKLDDMADDGFNIPSWLYFGR